MALGGQPENHKHEILEFGSRRVDTRDMKEPKTNFQGLGHPTEIRSHIQLIRGMARTAKDELYHRDLEEVDVSLNALLLLGAMVEQAFEEYTQRLQ